MFFPTDFRNFRIAARCRGRAAHNASYGKGVIKGITRPGNRWKAGVDLDLARIYDDDTVESTPETFDDRSDKSRR
jgi:hypothetical protein